MTGSSLPGVGIGPSRHAPSAPSMRYPGDYQRQLRRLATPIAPGPWLPLRFLTTYSLSEDPPTTDATRTVSRETSSAFLRKRGIGISAFKESSRTWAVGLSTTSRLQQTCSKVAIRPSPEGSTPENPTGDRPIHSALRQQIPMQRKRGTLLVTLHLNASSKSATSPTIGEQDPRPCLVVFFPFHNSA